MLDASINKAQPTTFVNIGLQNGVLLRTVLDPLNGQLTDTRTRLVRIFQGSARLSYWQILGYSTDSTGSGSDTTQSCHTGLIFSHMAKLHAPEHDAFYPAHI